jgi:hypothetical protein
MRLPHYLSLLPFGLAAGVSATAPQQAELPAASDLIARVGGEPVDRAGFRAWLVETHGWRHVDDYLDLVRLRQESKRTGIPLPTPTEIEEAFEQDWTDQTLLRHRGDEQAFLAELAESRWQKSDYRDQRLGTLELEVVAQRILKTRPPTDLQLVELWEMEFGKEGVRTHVRIAFFDRLHAVKPGTIVSKGEAEAIHRNAKERAVAFHAAVAADRPRFAARVRAESDLCTVPRFDSYPHDLRREDGEHPRLRADHFNGALLEPLKAARTGDLVGPIETPQGYYVVDVIAREPAPFEATLDELRAIWRDRSPSPGEVHWLKIELREKVPLERFPLRPPAGG